MMRPDGVVRLDFPHYARWRGRVRDNLGGRRQDVLDRGARMQRYGCLQHPVELDVVEEHRASFVRVSVIAIHKREMKVRAVGIAGVAGKTQEVTLRDGAALVGGAWKERQVCGDGAVLHVRVARELAVAMVDRDRVAAARDSRQLDARLGIGGIPDVEIDDVAGGNCDDLLPPHQGVGIARVRNRVAIAIQLGVRVPILIDRHNVVTIALVVAGAGRSEGLDQVAMPGLGSSEAKLMAIADPVADLRAAPDRLRIDRHRARVRGHPANAGGRCMSCRRQAAPG